MGQELILTQLTIPRSEDPDWDTAYAMVSEITEEDVIWESPFDRYADEGDLNAVQDELRGAIRGLQQTFKHGARDHTWFDIESYRVHVAGGSTWGDSPGDTYEEMQALWHCDVVRLAAGFRTKEA